METTIQNALRLEPKLLDMRGRTGHSSPHI